MHARERLYLTADRQQLVAGAAHPLAAFLYAAEGDEIPDSAAAKFGLVDGLLQSAAYTPNLETLLGSSILPALVVITETSSVQLGTIVGRAHTESGLTVDAWNALPEDEREAKLQVTLEAMRAEANRPPATTILPRGERPPKAKKAAAPKAKAEDKPKEQAPAENKEQAPAENKGG